jgi:cytoskeletal protein RodZ
MSKMLWAGAGMILIVGFTGKQLLWNKVSSEVLATREKEHIAASTNLQAAYKSASKYALPPLSVEEREKLSLQRSEDIAKYVSDTSNGGVQQDKPSTITSTSCGCSKN